VTLREFFFENFAGDLEYHPRRAVLYLGLAVAALCFWIFSPREAKFSALPLVFVLGSVTLLVKGIFLLRKSSEGLGLTPSELADLSDPSNRKTLPAVPNQAAQIVQDFGAGSLLLWPLLNVGQDMTIPGVARRAFPSFSVAPFSSSWAGSSAALLRLLGTSKSRVSKLSDDRTL
jgi:hypothetical protein